MKEEGYKKLKIYKKAHTLALKVHKMSLDLPPYELYEEGGQIRRSSKSVSSNIVEDFALRKYKNEYIRYLSRAYASSQETIEHLDYLYETGSLKDTKLYKELSVEYYNLCGMIYNFTQSVDEQHVVNR
jgi:four helix bundle protein